MNVLLWVALGVLLYWTVATQLERQGLLPEWVTVAGPLTTLHTQRGKVYLDRLAQRRRFWRAWANLGVGIALVVMLGAFLLVAGSALVTLRNPEPLQVTEPRNVLVIPGVNDFLPLSVAPEILFGLLVGMVVHEGGHGLLCRVEDIEIESMGLALLTVIPMGAFVEPDEESQEEVDRGGRTRMYAAGVTNNFAVTVLALLLLFGPIAGSIAVAAGAPIGGVMPDSPADEAEIEAGDRITAVGGEPVEDRQALQAALADAENRTVEVTVDGERDVEIRRSAFVTSSVEGTGVPAGARITAVDGTEVGTVAELRDALGSANETATLTVRDGDERSEEELPIGALVGVLPDGGLAEAGAEPGSLQIVTSVGGERVLDNSDLTDARTAHEPGDEVTVVAYGEDGRETYDVVLQGEPGDPRLGVSVQRGISGMTVDDLGLQYYPADRYLSVLGGGDADDSFAPALTDSFVGKLLFSMVLPFAAVAGGQLFPYNFPGFTGEVTEFFVVTGPLAPLGGLVFVSANVLFWIAWINFNLGLFNCIPAFPLDGGHILRSATEAVVSRVPVVGSRRLAKAVTISVGFTMGLSLLLMVLGPRYLL